MGVRAAGCLLSLVFFMAFGLALSAHVGDGEGQVLGVMCDKSTGAPLSFAHLRFRSVRDSSCSFVAKADSLGKFQVNLPLAAAPYRLVASCVGYSDLHVFVFFKQGTAFLGNLKLVPVEQVLSEVSVKAQQGGVTQKGDTTEIHTSYFKPRADASSYELVRKLPGITIEEGKVHAFGEEVSQVLVDGKVFFSADTQTALNTLPAHMVEKVQIFDKLSDQSRFSGFNDGLSAKTINLITFEDKRTGRLGKGTVGRGDRGRYLEGSDFHWFRGERRLSVNGTLNNVGLTGTVGGGNLSGSSGGRSGQVTSLPRRSLTGQGEVDAGSLSLNYNGKHFSRIITGVSYGVDKTSSDARQWRNGVYIADSLSGLGFGQSSQSTSDRWMHRFTGRAEAKLDSLSSLVCNANVSWHSSLGRYNSRSINYYLPSDTINWSSTANKNGVEGFSGLVNVLYMKRFSRKGRNVSISLNAGATDFDNRTDLGTERKIFLSELPDPVVDTVDNKVDGLSSAENVGMRLTFTERLSRNWNCQVGYNANVSKSSGQNVHRSLDNGIWVENITSSSRYEQRLLENGLGLGLAGRLVQGLDANVGMDIQQVGLSGVQIVPFDENTEKRFFGVLPNAKLQFRRSRNFNSLVQYRSGFQYPNVGNLQRYVDRSNPLMLVAGNPDLEPSYTHDFNFKSTYSPTARKRHLNVSGAIRLVRDAVGNRILLNSSDRELDVDGIILAKGVQLLRPDNLGQSLLFRVNGGYSWYVDFLKCNASVNNTLRTSVSPYSYNGTVSSVSYQGIGQGVSLSSNWGSRFDLFASYMAMINRRESGGKWGRFFSQNLSVNAFVSSANGWRLSADGFGVISTGYDGLGRNDNIGLNLAASKTVFKKRNGEVLLVFNDILNRAGDEVILVSEFKQEEIRSNHLPQYVMLTFICRFQHFPKLDDH